MEENLVLEQYSRFKKLSLEKSPYKCLLNANIEINPHQINAFCAAVQSLNTGGIILADEVGLGKTIEAGLVLDYVLNSGAKKILIALPAAIRKQWEIELAEKFNLESRILDRATIEKDYYAEKVWIENKQKVRIILTSYDFASKLIRRFPKVKWDFIIIDEAHNLRNVFHGTKRAKNLYDVTKGIPKILLTATPLQNSLTDLHGLVSFIDPRIFGSEKNFNRRFVEGGDYTELKKQLSPVLHRTLRKDVGKYMDFKKRECYTVDFHLTREESNLYNLVNRFLKQDDLYSIPTRNKRLLVLVIRKILASSSFAVVETFEVMRKRLEKLEQGTKSADAQEGFDLFWDYIEDEMDEDGLDDPTEEDNAIEKAKIQKEIKQVQEIINVALSIEENAKVKALKSALETAFSMQASKGINQKAVVFTESKRTQKYIAEELRKDGYAVDDILLFNGDFDDAMTKDIYQAWQVKNYGHTNYGRSVEYKHAIVDYFKDNAKVLIVTDVASEGLNLQFCNTVINYDLPWNPQKIEQRIGRCHRYGQEHDVVAINLLNTDNEADKRIYDILRRKFELFDGVFGSSDIALGALESGSSFEKRILEIYQKCDSKRDFDHEFDMLNRQLDSIINSQASQLRSLLLTDNPSEKEASLGRTKSDIDCYLRDINFWAQFAEPEMDNKLYFWEIKNWGKEILGAHGLIFIGAFCDGTDVLFPVLLLCDESGRDLGFDEEDIVQALEYANDEDIHYFNPTPEESSFFEKIYDQLTEEMTRRYEESVEGITEYNRRKLKNWKRIQEEQLRLDIKDASEEVEQLLIEESQAIDPLEKSDIRKKVTSKKGQLDRLQKSLPNKLKSIRVDMEKEIQEFDARYQISPLLLINIILKF